MTCEHKWQNTDKRANIWTCKYCDALYTTRSNIPPNNDDDDIQEYVSNNFSQTFKQVVRNETLEEVARAVHGFKAFEKDTMDSFAAYIRGLKR